MSILDTAKRRYSTKHFDPTRKIPEDQMLALEEVVRLSPSSINIQPWHIMVTGSEEGKQKVTQGTEGFYQFNTQKILDASNIMVLCLKTDLGEAHLEALIQKELEDGRYTSEKVMQRAKEVRGWFFNQHANELKDLDSWAIHQIYLALGNLLLAAADMGIDSLPIEGFDKEALSQALNLKEQNLEPVVIVALGYSTEDDFNKALPKSRFAAEDVFTHF
ncbi:hypothetical protein A6A19_01030 [Actinobacillus delphinicola]|uniref:oxygen-insensitive NAD(P)H nitroreductase n=1 Tax=Actinobacillus delphinicola TaxID=51161 RepID=UPI0024424E22|nr:oxygen-insensitive NAD(P)H nitroreductase [Actinobacillus delphinicola]MDG6896612.1 hypothetical protein [Actinobacillus delphinicola]